MAFNPDYSPQPVRWGGQQFTDPGALARWLRARGASPAIWAIRHPQAAAALGMPRPQGAPAAPLAQQYPGSMMGPGVSLPGPERIQRIPPELLPPPLEGPQSMLQGVPDDGGMSIGTHHALLEALRAARQMPLITGPGGPGFEVPRAARQMPLITGAGGPGFAGSAIPDRPSDVYWDNGELVHRGIPPGGTLELTPAAIRDRRNRHRRGQRRRGPLSPSGARIAAGRM